MTGLHEQLQNKWKDQVLETHAQHGDETVVVERESLVDIVRFLKEDPDFSMEVLMDLTVVDGLDMQWTPRFEVVYHFYSMTKNHRLRLKVRVEQRDCWVPTLTGLYPAANWFEREAWDMYGVEFQGHPDMRRILMYEGFEGYPLRKDYAHNKRQPLIGPKN